MFYILLVSPRMDSVGDSFVQGEASCKDRLQNEAPPAWEKYRLRAERLQGIIKRTTIRLAPKREVMDNNWCEIKQRDECVLFFAQYLGFGDPPDKRGFIIASNRQYGFELLRQDEAGPWILHHLDKDLSDGMTSTLGSPPKEAVAYWTNCPTTFELIPNFPKSGLQEPGFTLKGVALITRNGDQSVKAELDYAPPTDNPKIPSLHGWVIYDPRNYWVILEYSFQTEWKSTQVKSLISAIYEYEKTSDGFPIPKRVIRRITPEGGVDRESLFDFDLREGSEPESSFMMSAYGLPEPIPTHQPSRWYLWVAVAGLLCLSMAAILRWLARRAKHP